MELMSRAVRYLAAVAFAVAAFGCSGQVAHAEGSGILVVDPPTGSLDSVLTVSTVGPCERGVTLVVYGSGKGIDPATADNLVGNTSLGKLEPTYTQSHTVPLMSTLANYFQSAMGKAPKGSYDLVLACRDRTDFTDLQTFTATLEIDKDGNYRAVRESAQPIEQALADAGLDITPGIPEQVRALAADPLLGDGASGLDSASAVAATEPQAAASDTMDPARVALILAGVLLLIGAGWFWFRQGRKSA